MRIEAFLCAGEVPVFGVPPCTGVVSPIDERQLVSRHLPQKPSDIRLHLCVNGSNLGDTRPLSSILVIYPRPNNDLEL